MIKELTEVGEVTEVIRQIEHFFMQGSTLLSKIITTYIHRITIVVLHQAKGLVQHYAVVHKRSTVYYPQANSLAESTNKTLQGILGKIEESTNKTLNPKPREGIKGLKSLCYCRIQVAVLMNGP